MENKEHQETVPLKGARYTPTRQELNRCFIDDFISFYRAFFDEKILLVGGSSSVDYLDLEEYNEKGFYIVQLNHHLKRRPQQPCHWLIARAGSGMDLQTLLSLPQRDHVRFVSTACHKHTFKEFYEYKKVHLWPWHEGRYVKQNPYHPALEWCNQFWNQLKTNPVMGMLALRMIQILPVREIHLIGFDFWPAKQRGFKSLRSNCHYLPRHLAWLRDQYHTDFRIHLEPKLLELMGVTERGDFSTFEITEEWVRKV